MQTNPHTTIYVLRDPHTREIRYAGKTVRPLHLRLSGHLTAANKHNRDWYVCRWIRSLGAAPLIEAVMIVEHGLGAKTEIAYIALLRKQGCRLTNLTDGGDGALGYHHTPEHRAKLKGNKHSLGVIPSAETRRKIAEASRGRRHSETFKEQLRARMKGNSHGVGHKITEEHRQILRQSRKGNQTFLGRKHTPEARAKMSAALKGKKFSPSHRAKISANAKQRGIQQRDALGRIVGRAA